MSNVVLSAAASSCESLGWPEALVLVGLMATMVLIARYLLKD